MTLRRASGLAFLITAFAGCGEDTPPAPPVATAQPPPTDKEATRQKLVEPKTATFKTFEPAK